MGVFHAIGQHVAKDPAAAVDWYTRASEAGNAPATANLAVMYVQGDGVEKDLEYARELFDEAEYVGLDVATMREAVGVDAAFPLVQRRSLVFQRSLGSPLCAVWWPEHWPRQSTPVLDGARENQEDRA